MPVAQSPSNVIPLTQGKPVLKINVVGIGSSRAGLACFGGFGRNTLQLEIDPRKCVRPTANHITAARANVAVVVRLVEASTI